MTPEEIKILQKMGFKECNNGRYTNSSCGTWAYDLKSSSLKGIIDQVYKTGYSDGEQDRVAAIRQVLGLEPKCEK